MFAVFWNYLNTMRRIQLLIVITIVSLLSFLGCEKENGDSKDAKIETLSAEKGRPYVVSLTGRVSGLKGVALDFECGIEYSTDSSFYKDNTIRLKVNKNYSEDPYTITIEGVTQNQKYYYRAYYISQLKIYYGRVKNFTFTWDIAQNGSENGYQYVELGLSVRWATYNVGATKPEEYGDYYAWGETETKTDYTWINYKFRANGDSYKNVELNKYNTRSIYGIVDNKITLDPEDDVAHVKWGGGWRMPTYSELEELRNNCTWMWYWSGNSQFNGVAGYKVTSTQEGYTDRYIFLPAAGHCNGTSLLYVGSHGFYRLSSLYTEHPLTVYQLYFGDCYFRTDNGDRSTGQSVRPVCP